jgi:hypothetical protein
MGRVIDLVYNAIDAIQADDSLILDYDFMMGIFGDLQSELPELNTYMCVCVNLSSGLVRPFPILEVTKPRWTCLPPLGA